MLAGRCNPSLLLRVSGSLEEAGPVKKEAGPIGKRGMVTEEREETGRVGPRGVVLLEEERERARAPWG